MTYDVWPSASDVMLIKVVTYEGIGDDRDANKITKRRTSHTWRLASYKRPCQTHQGMLMCSVDDASRALTGQRPSF